MRMIAMHGHIVFDETIGRSGRHGPQYVQEQGQWLLKVGAFKARLPGADGTREKLRRTNDPIWLCERLDEAGIDVLGITTSPLLYLYGAPTNVAVDFHRSQNDCMAKFCAAYPGRFFWSASAPLQDIAESISELRRSAAMGARGVSIGADETTDKFDHPSMWPLYQALVELDMAIFLHPLGRSGSGKGGAVLSSVAGCVSWSHDAVAMMVLGGVFDDFPTLRVHAAHYGGLMPRSFEQMERFWQREDPLARCRRNPNSYRKNLWFDVLDHESDGQRLAVETRGIENLVMGSGRFWLEDVRRLDGLGLAEIEKEKIAYKNAERLLGVRASF